MYGPGATPGQPAQGGNPYQHQAVQTASPQALVTMLYDRALVGLLRAQQADGPGAYETINTELKRVQDIITELQMTLDFEQGGQVAVSLASLYRWCLEQVIHANVHKDVDGLADVEYVIGELRDAWEEATAGATVGSG